MGLRHICYEAERLPDWYGVAYRDFFRDSSEFNPGNHPDWGDWVRVCYPVPINLVVRLWHFIWQSIWRYVKCPHHFRPGLDINAAYRCRELEQENGVLRSDLEYEKTMNQSLSESRNRLHKDIDHMRDRVSDLEWENSRGRK